MKCITYKGGYKYQLQGTHVVNTEIVVARSARTQFVEVTSLGSLVIFAGYAWDGPSGPTFDTPSSMRASLVHDALYQLMREKLIGMEHKEPADRLFQGMCREDGMSRWRAWLWYQAVKRFGDPTRDPKRKVKQAGTC